MKSEKTYHFVFSLLKRGKGINKKEMRRNATLMKFLFFFSASERKTQCLIPHILKRTVKEEGERLFAVFVLMVKKKEETCAVI